MMNQHPIEPISISWDRVRRIFDDPQPPQQVTERQFDYMDDALHRIAKTKYEEFDFSDLWYYHHDLAYVDLQPELFDYLFPVCLMDWHNTLSRGESCSHGDSEFHYGLRHGNVLGKMVSTGRRAEIFLFFRDSFLAKLDSLTQLGPPAIESRTYADSWLLRFNSLSMSVPCSALLWDAWWACETVGRAIATLKYCSTLMYLDRENILYLPRDGATPQLNSVPPLWCNDSEIYDGGWLEENVQFLVDRLSVEYILDRLSTAASVITNEGDLELVRRMLADWLSCESRVADRIRKLPSVFTGVDKINNPEWSE